MSEWTDLHAIQHKMLLLTRHILNARTLWQPIENTLMNELELATKPANAKLCIPELIFDLVPLTKLEECLSQPPPPVRLDAYGEQKLMLKLLEICMHRRLHVPRAVAEALRQKQRGTGQPSRPTAAGRQLYVINCVCTSQRGDSDAPSSRSFGSEVVVDAVGIAIVSGMKETMHRGAESVYGYCMTYLESQIMWAGFWFFNHGIVLDVKNQFKLQTSHRQFE
ncbi:hypothetical protein EVG20_g11258 [Dentipellis fragilis]|uniref:Uncharacterized protein n=1 Tax=Dentipellis fragilis TaxID=205917 RepID=A0A4Y9XNG2_9AGAM|nr:hypothetical protein EVG20_g11258 [Dentipellis fragilis]